MRLVPILLYELGSVRAEPLTVSYSVDEHGHAALPDFFKVGVSGSERRIG